jgi:hypothetical protein
MYKKAQAKYTHPEKGLSKQKHVISTYWDLPNNTSFPREN